MGTGSIQRKTYTTTTGFFKVKDHNPIYGGDYWFIIRPLFGCEDERFFYVRPLENGEFEVLGEGYVITKQQHLTEMLRELREELAGVTIYFYFLDPEGRVIRKIADPPRTKEADAT